LLAAKHHAALEIHQVKRNQVIQLDGLIMSKPTYVVPPLCVSVEASSILKALGFGGIKQPRLPLPA